VAVVAQSAFGPGLAAALTAPPRALRAVLGVLPSALPAQLVVLHQVGAAGLGVARTKGRYEAKLPALLAAAGPDGGLIQYGFENQPVGEGLNTASTWRRPNQWTKSWIETQPRCRRGKRRASRFRW
jgi:hypothetical protein